MQSGGREEAPARDPEAQRLAALRRHGALDTAPEPDFDDLARLAAGCCGTPVALVSLVDADRVWFKAKVGLFADECPRAGSPCGQAILEKDLLVVPDMRADGRFAGHPLVSGEPHLRFYAGAPILTRESLAVGTACVMDVVQRELGVHQTDALRALGRQAASLLELRLVSERSRALLEVNNTIVSHLAPEDILRATDGALGKAVPHDRAALTILEPGRDVVRIFAFEARRPSPHFVAGLEIPLRDSPMSRVLETRRPLLRHDLATEQEWPVESRLASEGVRSLLVVPLVVSGRGIGTLNVGSYTPYLYTAAHVEFLEEVASQVALAVANARAYQEIASLKARLEAENVYLQEEIRSEHGFSEIVGNSRALLEVLDKVERVAPTDATVLLVGETGTGKELFARAIHRRSPRSERPLVKVNCGAIAPGLVESELFGHVKGAFTGALQGRTGRFELANGGTIFLDEVSELTAETQVKLLRVLQERELEPVGSSQTVRVDVRVIAASNRRLDEAVQAGRFRADLLYRLNVFPIEIPPLRERKSDLPMLVSFFVDRFSKKFGKPIQGMSRGATEQVQAYDWPGNVRELENVIERSVILARGPVLELEGNQLAASAHAGRDSDHPGRESLEAMNRTHILGVLERTGWIVEGPRGAATVLGLHPNTLRSRMKKLGIVRQRHDIS